jgi:hypothetical protein
MRDIAVKGIRRHTNSRYSIKNGEKKAWEIKKMKNLKKKTHTKKYRR